MIRHYDVRCEAPLWARGGHAQTLLGYLLPCPGDEIVPRTEGVRRRVLDLDDGDRIVLFNADPLPPSTDGARPLDDVVVHLFHGLTGSTDSNYVRLVADVMRRAGAHVVGFNHRGQGPGDGMARGIYHSGSAPDMWASISAARTLYPAHLHLAIGFSLSGNGVLLGAGRDRDRADGPDAVLAVNPPVDLSAAVRRIERGVNRLYDINFVRGMRRSMRARIDRGDLDPKYAVARRWTVRRADHEVTAPLAGFSTGEEYYARCSAAPWLGAIRVPAVVLSSADDPFIDPKDIEDGARDTRVFLHVEETGGHLGYLHAAPVVDTGPAAVARRRWIGGAALHYATELVGQVAGARSAAAT